MQILITLPQLAGGKEMAVERDVGRGEESWWESEKSSTELYKGGPTKVIADEELCLLPGVIQRSNPSVVPGFQPAPPVIFHPAPAWCKEQTCHTCACVCPHGRVGCRARCSEVHGPHIVGKPLTKSHVLMRQYLFSCCLLEGTLFR